MAYQALCNPGLGKFVDQAPGVSIWPQSTGVLFVFSISAYADPECDSKYYNLVKKIKSYTKTELADKVKKRYLTQLRIAYLLCKHGKKEQAAEVMAELREEHDFDTVFSTQNGN